MMQCATFLRVVLVVIFAIIISHFIKTQKESSMRTKEFDDWVSKGKHLAYKQHQIYYQVRSGSSQSNEALICLHGFPTFSYDWIKVLPGLLAVFRAVVVLDFVGFGDSSKPNPYEYSLLEQADIVQALATHLSLTHVHLLAHDYGDTVAQELLARHNDYVNGIQPGPTLLIKSVVLLNGGIFPETNFPRFSQKLMVSFPFLAKWGSFFFFKISLGDVFGPNTKPSEADYEDFYSALRNKDGHLVLPALLGYIEERRLLRDRWVGALQTTSVPVQVIYGPADPVNPPGFVSHYNSLIPNPRVSQLKEGVGHYPQWEDPDSVLEVYYQFLNHAQIQGGDSVVLDTATDSSTVVA